MNDRTRTRGLRAAVGIAIASGGLAFAAAAPAAEWYWAPGAAIGADYNDNPGLSSRADEEDSIFGAIGQLSLEVGYLAPTSSGWIRPQIRSRRYGSDDEERDSDDQFLDFLFRGEDQTSRWGLNGSWSHEQVRTAELADVILDPEIPELPEDDTGVVNVQGRRDRVRLRPFYERDFSALSAYRLQASFVDTSYDAEAFELRDYRDLRAEVQYLRHVNPLMDWVVGVFGRDYSSDERGDAIGYGLRTGIERRISETTRLDFLVGVESTDPDDADSETDYIADVFLTRRLQTTWLKAGYRRSLAGSGLGTISARDEVHLSFRRDLTELISAGLGLRAYRSSALADEGTDRDFTQLRAEFVWRLTQTFSLIGDYRYNFLDREDEPESADSNQAFLYLQWAPQRPGVQARQRLEPGR